MLHHAAQRKIEQTGLSHLSNAPSFPEGFIGFSLIYIRVYNEDTRIIEIEIVLLDVEFASMKFQIFSIWVKNMNTKLTLTKPLVALLLVAMSCTFSAAFAFDSAAAETMARQNGCFKCHAIDKKKDGPPLREVAAKYKGKSDAEARLITHITTGEKAKFPDGHEEEHKIIKTKDMNEIKNVIQWILSL